MRLPRHLRRDRRGATIVEFAIVMPVMALVIMGLGDMLYQMYAKELLNGSVQKAARDSAIQGGAENTAAIDAKVIDMVDSIMAKPTVNCTSSPPGGTYCATRTSYATFSSAGPEPFNDDNGNNNRDPGECYQDLNENGSWDINPGTGSVGQGSANDVTLYTMSVTYNRLFPVARLFGWSATSTIMAQTLLKNQPYASRPDPTIIWKCT